MSQNQEPTPTQLISVTISQTGYGTAEQPTPAQRVERIAKNIGKMLANNRQDCATQMHEAQKIVDEQIKPLATELEAAQKDNKSAADAMLHLQVEFDKCRQQLANKTLELKTLTDWKLSTLIELEQIDQLKQQVANLTADCALLLQQKQDLEAQVEKLTKDSMKDRIEILRELACKIHELNHKWWHDKNGQPLQRNKGELLCLIHSEISEAVEGERKNLMDDKLPHRKMAEVELADALIRILDYSAGFGYDISGVVYEKLQYNTTRQDHTHEAREQTNGKKW